MSSKLQVLFIIGVILIFSSNTNAENLPGNISSASLNNLKRVILDLFDEDKLDQAEKLLLVYEELQPDSKELNWFKVRLLCQKGEFEKASALALSFPPETQTGPLPVIEAARRKILAGDIEKGVDFLTLLSPEEKNYREIPCKLESIAKLLEHREQKDRARLLRETVIKKYPQCIEIKNILELEKKANLKEQNSENPSKEEMWQPTICNQTSYLDVNIISAFLLSVFFFVARKLSKV